VKVLKSEILTAGYLLGCDVLQSCK